ncbi:MAG: RNA pseudouridine synthase [Planctomycetes bacterium]|nr:RNA pseudouridine synthase [Planctomycetota bacterium]MCC8115684.1 RNA pseudouridine synthase [Planctomycetota bacterium]MCD7896688.1 RNA pseudouridine synthase [Planctomycetaceae bacterium]
MPESPVPAFPEILLADNHLIAVNKPAGMPSQPDSSGDTALDAAVRDWCKREYNKPGNVYLALLHRLDRPTSGAVLFAKTDKAAGRMADLFRKRLVDKLYCAVVECHREPGREAELTDWLAAGPSGMRVAANGAPGAREARLRYRVLSRSRDRRRAFLEIDLLTGVKHQIRCQLAARGLTVVGDFRYGPLGKPARPEPVSDGRAILLHARRIGFVHPVRKEPVVVEAPLPAAWTRFMAEFSGCDSIL